MKRILMSAALLGSTAILAPVGAYAGCLGGSIGEACIGIPTPPERPYGYEGYYSDRPVYYREALPVQPSSPVIIEKHHHHHSRPIVIQHEDD